MTLQHNIVKPLRLPAVALEQMRLLNAISLRGRVRVVRPGGVPVAIRWLDAAPALGTPALALRVTVAGDAWLLEAGSSALLKHHPLFSEAGLEGVEIADLPLELAGAIAQSFLEPLAAEFAQRIGAPVALEKALAPDADEVRAAASGPALGCALVWKEGAESTAQCFVRLSVPPSAMLALAERLKALPRTQKGFLAGLVDAVPYALRVQAGETTLAPEAFGALKPGDIVMPDVWLPAAGALRLILTPSGSPAGAMLAADAALNDHDVVMTTLPTPPENTMLDTDALDVKLTFELESRTMTIGDLKSLEPGYTFRLSGDAGAQVTVLANGRPVARGALVDAGGAVGVQLTECLKPLAKDAGDEH